MRPRCFVIQPFDGGAYDQRFDEVIAPAIEAAGFQAYRVDRDSTADNLNEQIEVGIRSTDACFADISANNPNVWFELGFAVALGKPAVLICSVERQRYPFDVHHRPIIVYKKDSPGNFTDLARRITEQLQSRCAMGPGAWAGAAVELSEFEAAILAAVAKNLEGLDHGTSIIQISSALGSGSEDGNLNRGIDGLVARRMLETHSNAGSNALAYTASRTGLDWLASRCSPTPTREFDLAPSQDPF